MDFLSICNYLCTMVSNKLSREQMWARQQISGLDVDYDFWHQKKEAIRQMSRISRSCIFTVDVFKGRYDFASENFADIFGYPLSLLKRIEQQGDLLEENIHPEDRSQLIDLQIKHSQFIYSLPFEDRNNYSQVFQFRMLDKKRKYINVISRQRVIQTDRKGKAWMVMGMMDIAPDQTPARRVRCSVLNLTTGEILSSPTDLQSTVLTNREIEILHLIRQGFLSKEIACKLGLSIHTVNNHRKNILAKLNANNAIEAINRGDRLGW